MQGIFTKLTFLIATLLFQNTTTMAQECTAPFHSIKEYPSSYTIGNTVSRMLEGLGYRYHWASKNLREEDLSYTPGNEGKTTIETLEHIYELAEDALMLSEGNVFVRPRVKVEAMPYEALRLNTLQILEQAAKNFMKLSDKQIEKLEVIFDSGEKQRKYPFWNYLNGQLSDAIYHTGQIVSYRRSSGNPITKEVNVFTGGM
jgi:hypothetical protein